jgi:hypothetical protein
MSTLHDLIYSGFTARQGRAILAALAGGGGGGGGGAGGPSGMTSVQAGAWAKSEVTTGNGTADPYTYFTARTFTFNRNPGGTNPGHVQGPALVDGDADGYFGFDMAAAGWYQMSGSINFQVSHADPQALPDFATIEMLYGEWGQPGISQLQPLADGRIGYDSFGTGRGAFWSAVTEPFYMHGYDVTWGTGIAFRIRMPGVGFTLATWNNSLAQYALKLSVTQLG